MLSKRSVVIKYEVTIKSISNAGTEAVRVSWQTNKASGKTKASKRTSADGSIEFKKETIKWENTVFIEDNNPGPCNFIITVHEKVGNKYQARGKLTINLNEFLKTDGWKSHFTSKDFTIPVGGTSSITSSKNSSSPSLSTGARNPIVKISTNADKEEGEDRGRGRRERSNSVSNLTRSSSRSSSRKRSGSVSGLKELGMAGGIAIGGLVGGVTGAVIGGIVSSDGPLHLGRKDDNEAKEEAEFLKLSHQQLVEEMKKKEKSHRDLEEEFANLKQIVGRQTEQYQKQQQQSQKEKDALEREKRDLLKRLEELERQSKLAGDQQQMQQQQQQEMRKLEQRVQDAQRQQETSQRQILELQDKLRVQQSETQRLQQLLQLQQQEEKQLKSLLDNQGKGNDEFMRIQKQKETELSQRITRLSSENSDLNQKVSRLNSENSSLNQRLNRLNIENADLTQKLSELRRNNVQSDDWERERQDKDSRISQLDRTNKSLNDQLLELKNERTKLKQINITQIYELGRVRDHEKELEAMVADLQRTKIAGEEGKKQEFAKDKEQERAIEELKRERDRYLKQLTDGDKELGTQIQSYINQIKELKQKAAKENEDASAELTDAKVRIQKLEHDLENKATQAQQIEKQWKEVFDKLQTKNEKFLKNIRKLEDELDNVKQQYSDALRALKKAKVAAANPKPGKKVGGVLAGLNVSSFREGYGVIQLRLTRYSNKPKIDSRAQLVLQELVTVADRLDKNSISTFVTDLREVAELARKKSEMAFWIKQITFLVDSFLEAFPSSHAIPGYTIAVYGIKVVGSDDDINTPKAKFVHDLIESLFWILEKYTNAVFEDAHHFLIDYVFPGGKGATASSDDSSDEDSDDSSSESNDASIDKIFRAYQKGLDHLKEWQIENSIIVQIFHDILQRNDTVLFNHLLKNTDQFCTHESAVHIKQVLGLLGNWKTSQLKGCCDQFSLQNLGALDYMTEATKLMVEYKKMPRDKERVLTLFPHLSLPHVQYIISGMQEVKESEKQTKYTVLGMLVGWGVIDPKLRNLLLTENTK